MILEEFKTLAEKFSLIPVYEVMTADMLTPVMAYLKLRKEGAQSFLLESADQSAQQSRYSFIGVNPKQIITNELDILEIEENGGKTSKNIPIFDYLKEVTKKYNQAKIAALPGFTGGLVGYLGYENIALIEKKLDIKSGSMDIPDSNFGVYDTILAFDHHRHQIILINNVEIAPGKNLEELYNAAKEKIKELKTLLSRPLNYENNFKLCDDVLPEID
jgi:anthranilate synthase component 1